jgi:hypothetical protein
MEIDGLDPVTPEEIAEGAKARRGRGGKVIGRGGDRGRGRPDDRPRREEGRREEGRREEGRREDRRDGGSPRRDDRRPRRDEPRREEAPREERAPAARREDRAPRERQEAPRERHEDRAPHARRDDRGPAPRRDDRGPAPRYEDRAARHEEYRRDRREDLGPPVKGFGDSVPAFMTIPIPRPKREEPAAARNDGASETSKAEAA